MDRFPEIYSDKRYWLAQLTVITHSDMLKTGVLRHFELMREMEPEDLKAICYALLLPRFQPQGVEFIQKKLCPSFGDREFSEAVELASTQQYDLLLPVLRNCVPANLISSLDGELAAKAKFEREEMQKAPRTTLEIGKEMVRQELISKLAPDRAMTRRV